MKKFSLILLLFFAFSFLNAEHKDLEIAPFLSGKVVSIDGSLIKLNDSAGPAEENDTFFISNEFYTLLDSTAVLQLDDVYLMMDEDTNIKLENVFGTNKIVEIWRLKRGKIAVKVVSEKDINVIFRNQSNNVLIKKNTKILLNEKGTSWVFDGEVFYFKNGQFDQDNFYLGTEMNVIKKGYYGTSIPTVGGEIKFTENKLNANPKLISFLNNKSTPKKSNNRKSNKDNSIKMEALPPEKKRPKGNHSTGFQGWFKGGPKK